MLSLKCFLACAFAEPSPGLAQNAGIGNRKNKTNTAILFMLSSQPLNQLGASLSDNRSVWPTKNGFSRRSATQENRYTNPPTRHPGSESFPGG
jgi:hypothetical protein